MERFSHLLSFRLPSTMFLIKNSPALYELLTNGPDAVYKNPAFFPNCSQWANFSGVTYSTTLRCLLVGCIYCPNVKQSTPASRRSSIVLCTSSSDSPDILMKKNYFFIKDGLRKYKLNTSKVRVTIIKELVIL